MATAYPWKTISESSFVPVDGCSFFYFNSKSSDQNFSKFLSTAGGSLDQNKLPRTLHCH